MRPHDRRYSLDVLQEGDSFPHQWIIMIEGRDYPKEITFNCYIEASDEYTMVNLPSEVPNAAQLKAALQTKLWGDNYRFAAKYLAQIQPHIPDHQVISQEPYRTEIRPYRRMRIYHRLAFDAATKEGNKYYIRITDREGNAVPKGHTKLTPDDRQTFMGSTNGQLPFLYKALDCLFEYPKVYDGDQAFEGYNSPTIEGVHYFNVQPSTTASEAANDG